MKVDDEINGLLARGAHRPIMEPPPKDLLPILKRMSERAEAGEAVSVPVLLDYVHKKTGRKVGRTMIRRWISEAGGRPWFAQ